MRRLTIGAGTDSRPAVQRFINSVGEFFKRVGLHRIGWSLQTFTFRGMTCHSCGRVSHTEPRHLLHHCDGLYDATVDERNGTINASHQKRAQQSADRYAGETPEA